MKPDMVILDLHGFASENLIAIGMILMTTKEANPSD